VGDSGGASNGPATVPLSSTNDEKDRVLLVPFAFLGLRWGPGSVSFAKFLRLYACDLDPESTDVD